MAESESISPRTRAEALGVHPADKEHDGFPIAGIGASAGGLEALTALLGAMPRDTGVGFVVVQHLSPDRASGLSEILARATALPVCEVRDESAVEPNRVYVI